jgi:hypothetical protein
MDRCVVFMGLKRNADRIMAGKTEGKRELAITGHRWKHLPESLLTC